MNPDESRDEEEERHGDVEFRQRDLICRQEAIGILLYDGDLQNSKKRESRATPRGLTAATLSETLTSRLKGFFCRFSLTQLWKKRLYCPSISGLLTLNEN